MRKLIMILLTLVVFTSFLLPMNNGYLLEQAEAAIINLGTSGISYNSMNTRPLGYYIDMHDVRSRMTTELYIETGAKVYLVYKFTIPSTCTVWCDQSDYGISDYSFPGTMGKIRLYDCHGNGVVLCPPNNLDSSYAEVRIYDAEVTVEDYTVTYKFELKEEHAGLVIKDFRNSRTKYGDGMLNFVYGNGYDSKKDRYTSPEYSLTTRVDVKNYPKSIPYSAFNSPPSTPGIFNSPSISTSIKGGEALTVKWGSSSDPDADTVRYQLQFYNGSTWSTVTSSTTATSYTWTVPTNITTSSAKFRVRAYDGTDYSSYRESSLFSIYQNSDPDIVLTSPSDNQTLSEVEGFNKVVISGNICDQDVGDNLTVKYSIEDSAKNPLPEHNGKTIQTGIEANGNEQDFVDYTITVNETIPEGVYTLKIWVEDDKGGKHEENFELNIDKSPPSLDPPNVEVLSDTEIKVTPAASDPSGLSDTPYLYNQNDTDITGWVSDNQLIISDLIPNTKYEFKYKAMDAVGNYSVSDYSPITSKFTLARNPEGLEVISRDSTSITFKILEAMKDGMPANTNPPKYKIEIKNKITGEVAAESSFDNETDNRKVDGLEADTEYEVYLTTMNDDGVANPSVSYIDGIISNYSPHIVVTNTDQSVSAIDGYNIIIITGKIHDRDGDNVTISATIGGVTKSTPVSSAPLEVPIEDNWTLTWDVALDEITEGDYTDIVITAEDDRNGSNTATFIGTIKVDRTAPIPKDPEVVGYTATEITIHAEANDNDNGVGLHETPYLYNRDGEDIGDWQTGDYTDSELVANTQYTYKYKARDAVGNESDYSTEVSKYTLALDPAELKVTAKDASTITFEIVNDEANGNPPEHRIEVKLVGAGIDGEIVSDSDFSIATTDRIVTELTPGTEYEVWVTTRNGDLEANEPVKLIANISTNYPPVLNVSNIDEDQYKSAITPYNVVKISGKIHDLDNDQVVIKATIGEVEKTVVIDSAPENEPDKDNWELLWDGSELDEGTYSGFEIVATDAVGNELKQTFTGTITIDHTAPEITPGYPLIDDADVTPDSIKVKMAATDNYTDVIKINYILEHNYNGTWEVVDEGENLTVITHSDLMGNNSYKYRFKVQDAVGNESVYSTEVNKFTKAHNPVGILVLGKTEDSFTFKLIENSNNANTPLYKVEVIEPVTGTVVGSNGGFLGGSDPIIIGGFATDKEYDVRITAANAELITTAPTTYTLIAPELEVGIDDVGPGDEKGTVIIDLPELPEGAVRYEYKVQDTSFTPRPMVGLVFNGTHLETPYKIPVAPGQYVGIAAVDADGRIIRFKEFDFNDPELIDKLPKFDSLSVEIDNIAVSEINIPEGLTKQLVVKAVYTGGYKEDITNTALYVMDDTTIATVTDTGVINSLVLGSTSLAIAATVDEITKEITLPVNVTAAVPVKLTVAADKYSIEIGQKAQVSSVLVYSNGITEDVTDSTSWTVSDPSKANILDGQITGEKTGDVTVTAEYSGFSDSLTITIKNPPPVLVSISVVPNSISLKVGETKQLTTTAIFSDGSIQDVTHLAKYLSEDSSVVAIEGNGVATCIAVGQTKILVEISGKQVSIPVEVEPIAPKVIDISAIQNVKLEIGEIKPIKVVAYLSDGTTKDVTDLASFTSQNSGIASVVRGGIIKGIAEGVTSIYVDYASHNILVSVTIIKDSDEEDDLNSGGKNDSNRGSDNKDTDPVTTDPQEQEPPTIPPSTPEPDIELPIVEPWQPVGSLQPELEKPIIDSSANNANPSGSDNGGYGRNTNNNKLKDNIDKGQNTLTPKYGTVFGRITDTAGRPMSNIRVELHSKPRITYSDNNGWYRFENVELGNHTIFINDDKLLSSMQVDLTVKLGLNEVVLPNTSKALLDLSDDSLLKEVNFVVVPKDDADSATDLVYDDNMKNKTGISINKIGDLYAQAPTAVKVTIATTIAGTTAAIPLIYWPRRKKNVIIRSGKRNVGKLTVQAKRTLVINITNQLTNFDTIQVIFKANLLKKMKDKTIVLRFGAKDIAYFVVTDQTTGLSAKVVADTLGVEWHSKEDNKK